jgi:hypothetical protein
MDNLFDEDADLANLRSMMGMKGGNAAPAPSDFDLDLPSLDDLDAFAVQKGITTQPVKKAEKAKTVAELMRQQKNERNLKDEQKVLALLICGIHALILDEIQAKVVEAQANKDLAFTFEQEGKMGIVWDSSSVGRVKSVREGGQAETLGLQAGDLLVQANDVVLGPDRDAAEFKTVLKTLGARPCVLHVMREGPAPTLLLKSPTRDSASDVAPDPVVHTAVSALIKEEYSSNRPPALSAVFEEDEDEEEDEEEEEQQAEHRQEQQREQEEATETEKIGGEEEEIVIRDLDTGSVVDVEQMNERLATEMQWAKQAMVQQQKVEVSKQRSMGRAAGDAAFVAEEMIRNTKSGVKFQFDSDEGCSNATVMPTGRAMNPKIGGTSGGITGKIGLGAGSIGSPRRDGSDSTNPLERGMAHLDKGVDKIKAELGDAKQKLGDGLDAVTDGIKGMFSFRK